MFIQSIITSDLMWSVKRCNQFSVNHEFQFSDCHSTNNSVCSCFPLNSSEKNHCHSWEFAFVCLCMGSCFPVTCYYVVC
jgi:hypothetical protein